MRFSTISAVCAFAATAYAQTAGFDALTSPTQDQQVAAGSTLNIVWEPTANYNNDTVSIILLEGSTPSTLSLGPIIASSLANKDGKFSWAIPSSIAPFATYGFKLTLDSDAKIFQYSFPFHITGASSSSSSSATGSMTTAASTKTMTLSTGTAYTPISTSSSSIYSSSANSSTIVIKTSSSASTMATVTAVKPTGNSTLTYISPTATAASTTPASNTGSGSATTSKPAAATTNAAVANIASGSLALVGGLVLALAL